MTEEETRKERRVCRRFQVPGATVNYALRKASSPDNKDEITWEEEFCPLLDISCGGVRYVGKKTQLINTEIVVKIFIPGERSPLTFLGEVRWLSTEDDKNICEMGVQFNSYGEGEGKNYPGLMVKLMELEHKFSSQDSDITKFEVDT